MNAFVRLILSAVISFVFYFAWAYYANSLKTDDHVVLVKAGLVQGFYSGAVTLFFTYVLEMSNARLKNKIYCLAFVNPTIGRSSFYTEKCQTTETLKDALPRFENACKGMCLPGLLISPLPALLLQSILVVITNVVFNTPNLWLTVLPSIVFSAIYGYVYSFSVNKSIQSNTGAEFTSSLK